jgi:hypothetical protein
MVPELVAGEKGLLRFPVVDLGVELDLNVVADDAHRENLDIAVNGWALALLCALPYRRCRVSM